MRIEERIADPARYAQLLEKFLGWYAPMEERLRSRSGWGEWGIQLAARTKTPWLEEDLLALGSTPDELRMLPRCTDLPAIETLSAGFGCAYVMEGATLGGRHISSLLQRSEITETARRFFLSYGSDVGEQWKSFLAALNAFAANGGETEEILEAANGAFASMDAWISFP